jgi:hypothetical protein
MITKESEKVLGEFYEKVCRSAEIKNNRKLKDSLLIEFIRSDCRTIYNLLRDSSIPRFQLDNLVIKDLLEEGMICETDKINELTITARGIWEIEKRRKILSGEKIALALDNWKFSNNFKKSIESINDKEKIILFSMIASRSFSEISCVNLMDKLTVKKWRSIIADSCKKLIDLEIIPQRLYDDLYNNTKESPVESLFRRLNNKKPLTIKTKNIYKILTGHRYYLDIDSNGNSSEQKLKFLFNIIFEGKKLSPTQLEEVYQFCCTTAHNASVTVFDPRRYIYAVPQFDKLIRKILF